MVIAEIGPDGKVSLLNSNGWTPVAVDVVGWFPAAGIFHPQSQ
jgi:hypothetical protein